MANSDSQPRERTVIVERSGSGGTVLIAIVLLIGVIVAGLYFFHMEQGQSSKDRAIADAATSVSHAADKVGDAASGASQK